MIDKIHLHAAGKLPREYIPFLGRGFDRRVATFMRVEYEKIRDRALSGGLVEEVFHWCMEESGFKPLNFEIEFFNSFMTKRGWRDDSTDALEEMKKSLKLSHRDDILTYFDMIVADESHS